MSGRGGEDRACASAAVSALISLMRETVEMIVKALVDDASAVDVREREHNGSTVIEVRVAETDMGKLIGRQGRTVRALRAILQAASAKRNRRFVLDIVE
ncbi:MAG TPA: KH domain-containing protein [Pyrinomonadaceae bacterium]|jgi:predicted RNA-binding protein YlqC (UPF0109 family)|nr:KH domain-containing protein [Pyrinomonadaceae bacterium]